MKKNKKNQSYSNELYETEDLDFGNTELKHGFFCRLFRRNKHKKIRVIQEDQSLLSSPVQP